MKMLKISGGESPLTRIKQSYRYLKKYSKSVNDNYTAKIFSNLDCEARSRLHNIKAKNAEQNILDLSESYSEEGLTTKERLVYLAKQMRSSFNYVKEAVLSGYYSLKSKR